MLSVVVYNKVGTGNDEISLFENFPKKLCVKINCIDNLVLKFVSN